MGATISRHTRNLAASVRVRVMIPLHVGQIYQSSWPTTPSITHGRGTRWTSAATWCPTLPPPCCGGGNASPSQQREQPTYGCTLQRASQCWRWVNSDYDVCRWAETDDLDRKSIKKNNVLFEGSRAASSFALSIFALLELLFSVLFEVTPMSDRDFGRYNCTARNNIGMRYQEFILAQAGEFASLPHITTSVASFQFPKCVESGFLHLLIQGSHNNCSNAVSLLTLMALFAILRKINSTTTPDPYSA